MSQTRHSVLLIGATDSSGGAGLGQDIRAIEFASHYTGIKIPYALAVSSVTVQTSNGVQAVHSIPSDIFQKQLWASVADRPLSAIKIGMLSDKDQINDLAGFLTQYHRDFGSIPVVLDPVFKASLGGKLQDNSFLMYISDKLFPLITLITPNMMEFFQLHHIPCQDEYHQDAITALLQASKEWGVEGIFLKGGHLMVEKNHDKVIDFLYLLSQKQQIIPFSRPRRPFVTQTRGTGCFLATIIAVCLSNYTSTSSETLSKSIKESLAIFDAFHS